MALSANVVLPRQSFWRFLEQKRLGVCMIRASSIGKGKPSLLPLGMRTAGKRAALVFTFTSLVSKLRTTLSIHRCITRTIYPRMLSSNMKLFLLLILSIHPDYHLGGRVWWHPLRGTYEKPCVSSHHHHCYLPQKKGHKRHHAPPF